MLVAEHGRAASDAATWWVAVVVLRYFDAVLLRRTPHAQGSAVCWLNTYVRVTVNVGVSGLGRGPASLEVSGRAPKAAIPMDIVRVLILSLSTALGSRGRADGGCAGPLPLVLSVCHPDQQVTGNQTRTSSLHLAAQSPACCR